MAGWLSCRMKASWRIQGDPVTGWSRWQTCRENEDRSLFWSNKLSCAKAHFKLNKNHDLPLPSRWFAQVFLQCCQSGTEATALRLLVNHTNLTQAHTHTHWFCILIFFLVVVVVVHQPITWQIQAHRGLFLIKLESTCFAYRMLKHRDVKKIIKQTARLTSFSSQ